MRRTLLTVAVLATLAGCAQQPSSAAPASTTPLSALTAEQPTEPIARGGIIVATQPSMGAPVAVAASAPVAVASQPVPSTTAPEVAPESPSPAAVTPQPVTVAEPAAPVAVEGPNFRQDPESYGPVVTCGGEYVAPNAWCDTETPDDVQPQLDDEVIGSARCEDATEVVVAVLADGSLVCGVQP